MAWFIGQSLLMILISFLLGLLVGWLIWSRRGKSNPDSSTTSEQPTAAVTPADDAPVPAAVVAPAPAESTAQAKPARKNGKKAAAAPADDQIEVQQHPVSLVAPIAKPAEPQPAAEPEVVAEPEVAPVAVAAEPDDSMEAIVERAEAAQSAGFAAEAAKLTPEEVVLVAAGDNLQRIEGIGPRMEAALTAAGLGTYAALAEADNDTLRNAIEAQGLKFAPALLTWARQARLLADGDEEALADLQRRLVAGRDTGRE
ncbi:hypothetical protein CS0771_02650 [Catellatospora sp. IY07-71]|uniref:helix-hairpin-helix domain-containing protein n=1 Tax=Catellatospora sp. IY07-71 TaxID=2728827 RepID=UPI001BB44BA9|nr:helix-hairpin-helix domain-containing protein [Catellatospora sp. IY07-71]BCJ70721.1 hypothetical protein CS0771_02650 [Catellatospora sp. IY07-71]